MTSHVVTLEFAKATQVRISAPRDRPTEALAALVELFAESPNVVSARLGMMEVLPEADASYFTYVVGIECEGGAKRTEQRAQAVLRELAPARLPVFIVPPTARYFTRDAVVFYSRKEKPKGWLRRLLSRRGGG